MVFEPMEPHDLLLGLGRVIRRAADAPVRDGYERSQLLSAYSVARHLAAEQVAAGEIFAWLCDELDAALAGDQRPAVVQARAAVAGASRGPQIGTALTRLFAALGDGERDAALRRRLHALLAELTDREVAALAAAEG